MKVDEHGCVITDESFPGCVGDSAAESGRLLILDPSFKDKVKLKSFITPRGVVRHPNSPWREDDTTSDQFLPILMATYFYENFEFVLLANKIQVTWSTGGGKFASPGVMALAYKQFHLLGALQVIQWFLFLVPIRWSDAHNRTGFWNYWRLEWSTGSSADWLNYSVIFLFLKQNGIRWPLWFLNRKRAIKKIRSYYVDQPNSDWLVRLYEQALT